MRKVTRVAVAMLLILSLSLTAFAAGSKTYATEVSSAKDSSGNAVEVTTTAASVQLSQADAESMIKADEGQVVSVAYTADVSVPEGTSFPVDITFSVSVYFRHEGCCVALQRQRLGDRGLQGFQWQRDCHLHQLSPVARCRGR